MSGKGDRRLSYEFLIQILNEDRELCEELFEYGILERRTGPDSSYSAREIERARICRTLVRELEVNLAGAEIILRLREELMLSRRQIEQLFEELARMHRSAGSR